MQDIEALKEQLTLGMACHPVKMDDWTRHWGYSIEMIQLDIVRHAQSAEEAMEAVNALSSALTSLNWEAIFEEKRRKVETYLNESIPCLRCHTVYLRKNLVHGDLCEECDAFLTASKYRTCAVCDEKYRWEKFGNDNFCPGCRTDKLAREATRVIGHNNRARELSLPATLTVKQWLGALDYFDWKCAYCSGKYQGLEHYLSLSLAGGTTVENCLPSCYRCNTTKKDKHPDVFTRLFPAENLARIRGYFESVSSLV